MMSDIQEFTNYGIWVCDIIVLVLLANYLWRCFRGYEGNPTMAFAFFTYISGHTMARTWVLLTHQPILYSHWVDVLSAIVAAIGLVACIRAFSAGSTLWVWTVVAATVVAASMTILL